MTYEEFKRQNDTSKRYVNTIGRIKNVNLQNGTCELYVHNDVTRTHIAILVKNIVEDGFGAITNPYLLKRWNGFDK